MSLFMIRIQLPSPSTAGDYAELRDAMEKAGASKQIVSDTGRSFELPHAEYCLESSLSIGEVRDRVVSYAKKVDRDPSVMVTEGVNFSWRLQPSD